MPSRSTPVPPRWLATACWFAFAVTLFLLLPQRRLHGMDSFSQPSRFISEIPAELVEEVRPRVQVSRPMPSRGMSARGSAMLPGAESGVRLGQRVRHVKFGDGVILNCEGQGAHARVEVNFETAGTKWLVLSYANLDLM